MNTVARAAKKAITSTGCERKNAAADLNILFFKSISFQTAAMFLRFSGHI